MLEHVSFIVCLCHQRRNKALEDERESLILKDCSLSEYKYLDFCLHICKGREKKQAKESEVQMLS